MTPAVDVNLFAYNAEATIAAAIESVLGQSWPALRLTVIDNGSSDATVAIATAYARDFAWIDIKQNRVNVGPILNCQRAFWWGNADFVLPKTADDILAPNFVEAVMATLLEHPNCAMCHAAGLVFAGDGRVVAVYPPAHRLHAVGADRVSRAIRVMETYTSAPSFWGIYRRTAVDQLGPIRYLAGWDHAVLAEIALYGEVRHVPEVLFWRRDGGKPVAALARGCSAFSQRGHGVDDVLADHYWRTPLITTAYAHLEAFAAARVSEAERVRLMSAVPRVFGRRWGVLLQREETAFRAQAPMLLRAARAADGVAGYWGVSQVAAAMRAISAVLPEAVFGELIDLVLE